MLSGSKGARISLSLWLHSSFLAVPNERLAPSARSAARGKVSALSDPGARLRFFLHAHPEVVRCMQTRVTALFRALTSRPRGGARRRPQTWYGEVSGGRSAFGFGRWSPPFGSTREMPFAPRPRNIWPAAPLSQTLPMRLSAVVPACQWNRLQVLGIRAPLPARASFSHWLLCSVCRSHCSCIRHLPIRFIHRAALLKVSRRIRQEKERASLVRLALREDQSLSGLERELATEMHSTSSALSQVRDHLLPATMVEDAARYCSTSLEGSWQRSLHTECHSGGYRWWHARALGNARSA